MVLRRLLQLPRAQYLADMRIDLLDDLRRHAQLEQGGGMRRPAPIRAAATARLARSK